METESHLGGHNSKTNIDVSLLNYLKDLGVKSMLDIGCGPGGMVDCANKIGINAVGIEGDINCKGNKIINFDLTNDVTSLITELRERFSHFDCIYSCEFLEHVEEKYQSNYMKLFELGKMCVITAAPPKWKGIHHVNCRTTEYWIKVFNDYKFIHSPYYTSKCREKTRMRVPDTKKRNEKASNKEFIRIRGLAFLNTKIQDNDFIGNVQFINVTKKELISKINKNLEFDKNKIHICPEYVCQKENYKIKRDDNLYDIELPLIGIIDKTDSKINQS